MPKARHLLQWYSCQRILDGESIPKHMKVSGSWLSIGFQKQLREEFGGLGQDFGKDLDPIRDFALSLAPSAPEEMVGMGERGWRYTPEFLGNFVREQYADWGAGLVLDLRLIEDEGVVVAKFAFCKAGTVAGAKTAPSQQLEVCADSARIGGLAIPLLSRPS